MPTIDFGYKGNRFKIDVDNKFMTLPENDKVRRLSSYIEEKHGDRPARPSIPMGDKGVLDYISLLTRPGQAFWTGVKESDFGGNVFRAMGGVDLTPEEGFMTGAKRGWLGDDEVRTQDFLPDDMNPKLKMVLGFGGDVVMDPLTWSGGAIGSTARGAGRLAKAAVPRSVADKMQRYKAAAIDKNLITIKDKGYGLQDIARAFNKPLGDSRKVKGVARQADEHTSKRKTQMVKAIGELQDNIANRASVIGSTPEKVHEAFYRYAERPGKWDGNNYIPTPLKDLKTSERNFYRELEELMGPELTEVSNTFAGRASEFLNIEKAYGMPLTALAQDYGYFPHAVTPGGKKLARAENMIEEFHPITGLPLDAGYVSARKADDRLHNILQEKRAGMTTMLGSKVVNPTDNLWEMPYAEQFMHTDPVIAWSKRWSQHNNSLQRKWFVDEITDEDMFAAHGGEAHRRYYTGPDGKSVTPAQHGFGKWVRKSPEGDTFQQMIRNADGDVVWTDVTPDMTDWVPLSFVKNKHIATDDVYIERAVTRADELFEKLRADEVAISGKALSGHRVKALRTKAYREASKEIDALKASEVVQFKAPPQTARQMEQELKLMTGDKEINSFLNFYDKTQDAWKSWTLAVRPGYHTRNAVGNMLNAYMIAGVGTSIPKAVKSFKDAAKLQFYSRFDGSEMFRDQTINNLKNIRGTNASKADRALLKATPHIKDSNWTAPDFSGTGYSMEDIAKNAKDRGISAGHYHKDIIRDLESKVELAADPRKTAQLKRFIMDNPAVEAGFAFGGTIEGNARYAVFLHTLREIKKNPEKFDWISPTGDKINLAKIKETGTGKYRPVLEDEYVPTFDFKQSYRPTVYDDAAFDIASQKVKESLFDYSDISLFEKNIMKRVLPFYTWTRKNIPAQLKVLVQNPERAAKVEIAKQQFEHQTGGYDVSEYGAFWGDRVPIFLGAETNGIVKAFTMLNVMPMADLQRILKPRELLTEMVSPIPKTIFENIYNYDAFRSMSGKQSKKLTEDWQESKDFLGVALPPKLWHLAQLIVPLAEVNRANPFGVFGEKTIDPETGAVTVTEAFGGLGARRESNPADIPEAVRWLRFFSGFRVYDVDMHQQRYYMNKNLEKDLSMLKNKLKWARRKQEHRKADEILDFIDEVYRQDKTDPYNK